MDFIQNPLRADHARWDVHSVLFSLQKMGPDYFVFRTLYHHLCIVKHYTYIFTYNTIKKYIKNVGRNQDVEDKARCTFQHGAQNLLGTEALTRELLKKQHKTTKKS